MHRAQISEKLKESRAFLGLWGVLSVLLGLRGALAAHKVLIYDFRTFYTAGYLLRTNPANLYNWTLQKWVQDRLIEPGMTLPYVSPAYAGVLFEPLSRMTYGHAYLCFLAINVTVLLAAFWVGRDTFSAVIPLVQPRPGLMLLVFFPLLVALLHGQLSIMLLLVCCATWTALQRGRVGLAGLILAAGICKFNLIVPIALVLAVRWGWRFVAGFMSGVAAALAASTLLVGPRGMVMLVNLLHADTLMNNQGAAAQYAMSAFPKSMLNLYGLVYASVNRLQRPGLTFGLTMVLSALVVAVCVWLARREWRDEVAFSVAILCGLLVSYHMYVHDLTLLVLPLALLHGIRNYKALVLVSYGLPVFVLFCLGINYFYLVALMLLWAVWLVARSQQRESDAAECLQPAAAAKA